MRDHATLATDIAVRIVVRSNIFNGLGIAGASALIHPLAVPAGMLTRDIWWMLGASALRFPLMKSGMRGNRTEGAVLFLGFLVYMAIRAASA